MSGGLDRVGRWFRQARAGQALAARLGGAYMRLVHATTRWQIEGRAHYDGLLAGEAGVIASAWHGRLFLSPFWVDPGRPAVALISNNRDGDLIAALVRRFGVVAVRGSTYDVAKQRDKGGAQAYAEALVHLDRRALVAITPDGPRGPRMRAARGIAALSIQAQVPIQPVSFSARRGKVLRSWDRFLVPWPFGRGAQVFGEPLWPPEADDDATVTAYLARIEAALIEVTNRSDDLCGRARITPGASDGSR